MLLAMFFVVLLVTWVEKLFLVFGASFIILLALTLVGLRLAPPTASRGWSLWWSGVLIVSATLLVALVAYFVIIVLFSTGSQG